MTRQHPELEAAAEATRQAAERLDATIGKIVDTVLAYRPKPKSKPAKRRKRRAKKAQRESSI